MKNLLFSLLLLVALAAYSPAQNWLTSPDWFDDFPGSSLDARWSSGNGNSGTVTVTDSYVQFDTTPGGATGTGYAFMYHGTKIDKTKDQVWVFCLNNQSAANNELLWLVNRSSAPAATDVTTYLSESRIRINRTTNGTSGIGLTYYNSSHSVRTWNGATNAWDAASNSLAVPRMADADYYIVAFENDATNAQWRIGVWGRNQTTYDFDQGYRMFALTDWITWSSMETTSDLWLGFGDVLNDVVAATSRFEWVRYAEGTKTYAMFNGTTSGSAAYTQVKAWYTYDGGAWWMPFDRSTAAVTIGSGGAWDDEQAKDKTVVKDSSTYYMFYAGNGGSGWEIGLATASDPLGTWTKDAGNPVLARVAAGDEDQIFAPFVVKDMLDPDSNKRWKMWYSGFSASDSKWRCYLATAPNATGTWTRQGLVLGPGGASTYDEAGCSNPVVFLVGGRYEFFYAGRNASGTLTWTVGRATTGNLNTIPYTKDTSYISGQVDSIQDISANLSGNTASMTSTTGFAVEQPVMVNQNATADDWSVSRVRKVNTNTSLELYHSLNGFTTASSAQVRGLDAGSVTIHHIEQKSDRKWYFYVTLFQLYNSHGSFQAFGEFAGLLSSDTLLGSKTWEWRYSLNPTVTFWDHTRSNENIAIPREPERAPAKPRVGRF